MHTAENRAARTRYGLPGLSTEPSKQGRASQRYFRRLADGHRVEVNS
jgi:hypothetical protein